MRIEEGKENDKNDEVDEMRSVNREEESESKDETCDGVRRFFALNVLASRENAASPRKTSGEPEFSLASLDFTSEPEEEGRPKDEHDEGRSGAGEIEKRSREDGQD